MLFMDTYNFLKMCVLVPEKNWLEPVQSKHLALQVWPAEIDQSNCILACLRVHLAYSPPPPFSIFEREESTSLPSPMCILLCMILRCHRGTKIQSVTGQCSPLMFCNVWSTRIENIQIAKGASIYNKSVSIAWWWCLIWYFRGLLALIFFFIKNHQHFWLLCVWLMQRFTVSSCAETMPRLRNWLTLYITCSHCATRILSLNNIPVLLLGTSSYLCPVRVTHYWTSLPDLPGAVRLNQLELPHYCLHAACANRSLKKYTAQQLHSKYFKKRPINKKILWFFYPQSTAGKLTTGHGAPIGDKNNSLSAGPRGPLLLQDVNLVDEIAHFDRERIPERVVHAKGAGMCI